MKYKVIDNFLDENYFKKLVTLFKAETDPEELVKILQDGSREANNKIDNPPFPWFYVPSVVYPPKNKKWKPKEETDNSFYMSHLFYNFNTPISRFYDHMMPLLQKIGIVCLMRMKANLYPNTHTLQEHSTHTDYPFSHSGAILSLNTCDGYTKLKDGTKIDSVANRILLFDASEVHCSTNTTNVSARINININYF